MNYTINELRKKVCERAYEVYDIFCEFFGEAYVDIQNLPTIDRLREMCSSHFDNNESYVYSDLGITNLRETLMSGPTKPFILVWWPRVTVTNENNRSIDITDLFAKVTIDLDGTIPWEYHGFTLNRSSYTVEQFNSDYCHSHVCGIPFRNFRDFLDPCLGRGPIIATINTLKHGFDNITWLLFCQELSMYVTVESLGGGPYRHLEYIGRRNECHEYNDYQWGPNTNITRWPDDLEIKDFIVYYLENGHLTLNYRDGSFIPGMSCYDYIIDISNALVDFLNQKNDSALVNRYYNFSALTKLFVADRKFYSMGYSNVRDYLNYVGSPVCTFKGEEKTLVVTNNNDTSEVAETVVINYALAFGILSNILRVINYRYANKYDTNGSQEKASTTSKKTWYI